MKITNLYGLPQPIVDAVKNDPYDDKESDISVTRLIQPPRKVELERRHASKITEDASERIWSLTGQLGHLLLERAGNGAIVERRLFADVLYWKVSGQVDLIPPDSMVDYKFTSVWAIRDGVKSEWESQMNLNRLLCIENSIPVSRLEIVAILRDWTKPEAARDKNYPQSQVAVLPVSLWPIEKAHDFLIERVKAHQAARLSDSSALPECTAEETWERPTRYAVKKNGNVRALKLYDTLAEAEAALRDGQSIEVRPGERPRCQHYCAAAPFCSQYEAWKTAKL